MSFKVLHEKKPACPAGAMAVIIMLAVALLAMSVAFGYLLLTGKGSNYLLGTLLAFEFLIAGVELLLFGRYFVAFREVSEEREEELLW